MNNNEKMIRTSLFLSIFAFLWLGVLHSLHGNASLLDRNAAVLLVLLVNTRSGDAQHPIRRQIRHHIINIVAFGQDVSANEMAGDEAVVVLLLLVFALDSNGVVASHFDSNFLGGELLHVQVHFESILVGYDRRAGVSLGGSGAPGPVVARGASHDGSHLGRYCEGRD